MLLYSSYLLSWELSVYKQKEFDKKLEEMMDEKGVIKEENLEKKFKGKEIERQSKTEGMTDEES